MTIQEALNKVLDKVDLKEEEMISVMTQIMEGQAKRFPVRIFFLLLYVLKGKVLKRLLAQQLLCEIRQKRLR